MTTTRIGPSPPPVVQTISRADAPLAAWRVGQLLSATVVATPAPGRAELRVGSLPVTAQTGSLVLSPGQQLRLEVASLRAQPVLKILDILRQDPVQQALRATLPRQQPLAPLFAALGRLVSGPTGQFDAAVMRLAREVLARLPTPAGIAQPSALRQALRDSGMFLEARLAQAPVPAQAAAAGDLARDLKANLLRLAFALRETGASSTPGTARAPAAPTALPASSGPAAAVTPGPPAGSPAPATDPGAPLLRGQPPRPVAVTVASGQPNQPPEAGELRRQVEGALARVQLNQLSSLPQERALPEWLIELPVRRENDVDVWGLRLFRDRDSASTPPERDEDAWSVMLAFDLPGTGPMQTRISLRGDQVAAQFFSGDPAVLPLVSEHLPMLQARLQQAGLQVSELSCHTGEIPAGKRRPGRPILDERA